jgi:hypothetical protein
MTNKVSKKSLKKITKKSLKKITKKSLKKITKKSLKKITKKSLKKITKKVIQKRGGGNCFRKPCDNGNSNKNSNEKVGFNSLPTEIHENIISYLLPMDYINYSKINQRYKDLAKYTLHLKSMARYWKALKNPPIGQFIRAWCDKMLLFNGKIEDHKILDTMLDTMLDSLERAALLDDLFHNLTLTIYHNLDISINPYLASFEARLMSIESMFQHMRTDLEFNFNLEKIRAINTFVSLNKVNDSNDILIAMQIINEKKDIDKYQSIHTSLLKKFDKEEYLFILKAELGIPKNYLLSIFALNGLFNPDLDNEANIKLRVDLFEQLFKLKKSKSFKKLMMYLMYIPTFMCKILLKKLREDKITIKETFKFFTLPIRCGFGPYIYYNVIWDIVPDNLKVRNYQAIDGFTEEKFNKFLENIFHKGLSVDLMNEYARKIGLFNDSFCYYIENFIDV